MSTTTNSIQVTMMYNDTATRTYELPNVTAENVGYAKSKVIELNKVFDGAASGVSAAIVDYANNMKLTFVSSDGAALARIAKASWSQVTEEVIYNVNS